MQHETQLKYEKMCEDMSRTYQVKDVTKSFAVQPSLEQKLVKVQRESLEFLNVINFQPVKDISGQKLFVGTKGRVTKRTNVDTDDRTTIGALNIDNHDYSCSDVEVDTHITYKSLDAWNNLDNGEFQKRYRADVIEQSSFDKCAIGWYGESEALTTNPVANPNLEDVKVGWYHQIRTVDSGSICLSEGATAGEIRIGEGGDFANLDEAVTFAKLFVAAKYRGRNDLVALIGSDLISLEEGTVFAINGHKATEKAALTNTTLFKTYGNLPAMTPPEFPARGILVLPLSVLSIYWQIGSTRRHLKDNPTKKRVEDYTSRNEDYVVEDFEKCGGFDFKNVKLKQTDGTWA